MELNYQQLFDLRQYAWRVVSYHVDDCGEVNCTSLGEDITHNSPLGDLDAMLDEPDSDVWQVAFDIANEYEAQIMMEEMTNDKSKSS